MNITITENLKFIETNKSKWEKQVPCFIINTKQLEATISEIKKLLPGEIVYSHKTNPDQVITKAVIEAGCGFLFSSPEETEHIIKTYNVPREKLIFQSPSLTKTQYDHVKGLGVFRFIIDSKEQLDLMLESIDNMSQIPEILVRINTGVKVPNPELNYSTDSYLGFPMDESVAVFAQLNELRKKGKITLGVHNHLLSQNTFLEMWEKNLETIADFVELLKKQGIEIDKVDFGGGYPIKYHEPVPELSDISKLVIKATDRMKKAFPKLTFIFEPGRKVVGESVTLIGQVAHVKQFRGNNVAILNCSVYNASLDTLIVGLILDAHKIGSGVATENATSTKKTYVIRGSTPDSLDIFSKGIELPELTPGDHIAFMHAGAYSLWSDFISLVKPPHIAI